MPSEYLQAADYAEYGVPSATVQQVQQASTIIDGYLKRREGLIYETDGWGNPCCMAAKEPTFTLVAQEAFGPGAVNVVLNVTGPINQIVEGEVLIVDRGLPTEEAVVVQVSPIPYSNSPNGQSGMNNLTGAIWGSNGEQTQAINQITIASCSFAHAANAQLLGGLVIKEEHPLPSDRPICQLNRVPAVAIMSGQGRYGYGRRGNTQFYAIQQFNLLNMLQGFTGPPLWINFQVNINNLDPERGTFWVPSGVFLAYYSRVRAWYVAGFSYENLPSPVKQACANVMNVLSTYGPSASIAAQGAGAINIKRFQDTVIDADTRELLRPYTARLV